MKNFATWPKKVSVYMLSRQVRRGCMAIKHFFLNRY